MLGNCSNIQSSLLSSIMSCHQWVIRSLDWPSHSFLTTITLFLQHYHSILYYFPLLPPSVSRGRPNFRPCGHTNIGHSQNFVHLVTGHTPGRINRNGTVPYYSGLLPFLKSNFITFIQVFKFHSESLALLDPCLWLLIKLSHLFPQVVGSWRLEKNKIRTKGKNDYPPRPNAELQTANFWRLSTVGSPLSAFNWHSIRRIFSSSLIWQDVRTWRT